MKSRRLPIFCWYKVKFIGNPIPVENADSKAAVGGRMGDKMEEAWDTFLVSGKITDYLRYKHAQAEQQGEAAWNSEEEWPDGTKYCGDRDGLKCNAGGRI